MRLEALHFKHTVHGNIYCFVGVNVWLKSSQGTFTKCVKNSWRDSDLQIPNAGLFAASSIEWPSTFYAYLFLCSLVIQALKKVLWLLCF